LKPINLNDYNVTLTVAQQARLSAIFPQGVCDYTKPGVEQVNMNGTWLNF
jgi:hypothetical protein